MKSLPSAFCLILLCSCVMTKKYESNQDRVYHNSLTDEEKQRIISEGRIFKTWNGSNSLGDYERGELLIVPATDGKYKFIEIGHWETLHKVTKGNKNLGWLKKLMNFDSLGNLRSGEYYFGHKSAENFYLAEKITTTINEQKKLILFSERFDSSGRKMYHVFVEYVNYLKVDKDISKEKLMIGSLFLNPQGETVRPYRDKESEGMVRIVRMKK